jgi:L-lactate dehydrogenase complex protein LldG
MASAREAILGRLRLSGAGARLPRVTAAPRAPAPGGSIDDCVRRFQHEAAALGVECFIESRAEDVRTRLEAIVAGCRLLSWDPEQLPYGAGAVVGAPTLGRSPRSEQALAEAGVTGCDAAIAETATLVLLSAPGRSRIVSLLPPVHVALAPRQQFVFSMADFFATSRSRLCQSSSCTFITGPSRTADIELTLTLGIHGPGRVIVIVGP